MTKLYWFQNLKTKEYLEHDEDSAWKVFRGIAARTRRLKYIGWSSGEFAGAITKNIVPRKDKDTGMQIDASKEEVSRILEARDKEIEMAKQNPERPPVRAAMSIPNAEGVDVPQSIIDGQNQIAAKR